MLIIVLLLLALVNAKPVLAFGEDRLFRILHLTDLHFGEDQDTDKATMLLIDTLLNKTKCNVAAITGDLVSNYARKEYGFAAKNLAKIYPIFGSKNIPYFYVKGNHDHFLDLTQHQFIQQTIKYPLCLTEQNPIGKSNFVLKLYYKGEVAYSLWGIDGTAGYESGWGLLQQSQVIWIRSAMKEFKSNYPNVKGIAFKHTPTIEFTKPLRNSFGDQAQPVQCSPDNPSIVQIAREYGILEGLFVGHDHLNSYTGNTEDGFLLSYGVKTGGSGYGSTESPGARIITLKYTPEKVSIEIQRVDASGNILNEEVKDLKPGSAQTQCLTNSKLRTSWGLVCITAIWLLVIALIEIHLRRRRYR